MSVLQEKQQEIYVRIFWQGRSEHDGGGVRQAPVMSMGRMAGRAPGAMAIPR